MKAVLILFFLVLFSRGASLNIAGVFRFNKRLESTEKLNNASRKLKVSSPWNSPAWVWKWCWKVHQFLLPLLHKFDRCQTKESFVNLPVLWWKAISGNQRFSIGYDFGYSYDLLPGVTRSVVSFPLCYLYPPLHHQNVLLRTVYLNQCLERIFHTIRSAASKKPAEVDILTLGAGFDARCLRLLNQPAAQPSSSPVVNITCYECDQSSVILQKKAMFERFQERRRGLRDTAVHLPHLLEVDLNHPAELQTHLQNIFSRPIGKHSRRVLIVVVEAVLLYLQPGRSTDTLLSLSSAFAAHCKSHVEEDVDVYFCFADRLSFEDNINEYSYLNASSNGLSTEEEGEWVRKYLKVMNYDLIDYLPKPGKAKHMGLAKLLAYL